MSKTKRSIKVNIKGQEWTVFLQTSSAYVRMHGKDSHAIAYPKERELYFNKQDTTLALIRHEVFHAFVNSTDTEYTAKMTAEDQEEIDCTVYGNNKTSMQEVEDKVIDFALKGGLV